MIEEELILELKSNLPKMFKVLSKLSKLDIGLAFVDYIQNSKVGFSRPILLPKQLDPMTQNYLNSNSPVLLMRRGYNPMLAHFLNNTK